MQEQETISDPESAKQLMKGHYAETLPLGLHARVCALIEHVPREDAIE